MSAEGTAAGLVAAVGMALLGAAFKLVSVEHAAAVAFAAALANIGESFVGALLQGKVPWLTNDVVNASQVRRLLLRCSCWLMVLKRGEAGGDLLTDLFCFACGLLAHLTAAAAVAVAMQLPFLLIVHCLSIVSRYARAGAPSPAPRAAFPDHVQIPSHKEARECGAGRVAAGS